MADAVYDAIIVGGGTKGLVLGCYLTKYGGLKTAMFDQRHELGGCWATEEFVPGFAGNTHATGLASWYLLPMYDDFPEIVELGGEWIPYKTAFGAVFKEDDSGVAIINGDKDPYMEKTAKNIGRFSEKDAETWAKIYRAWKDTLEPALMKTIYNLPVPLDRPDPVEIAMMAVAEALGGDPSWFVKSPLQLGRELFEDDAILSLFLRISHSSVGCSPETNAVGLFQLLIGLPILAHFGCAKGGTHSYAHATSKIYTRNGGLSFTKSEVDKILVENGRANGIKLVDGTEVKAKVIITAGIDPYTLFFRLLRDEDISPKIKRKIEHLSRKHITITWYSWAVHELPDYKPSNICKDINDAGWMALISKDPEELVRTHARKTLGEKYHPENNLVVWAHTIVDPTQAPEGKHVLGTEDFAVPPASVLDERGWREWKKDHAERVMKILEKHTNNMNWDQVIGFNPLTPFDAINVTQTGPEGCWATLDHLPGQFGRHRPIPELADHRNPVKNLYNTGAGWPPGGGGFSCQGYNCYKAIAEDMNLRSPEKEERGF